MTSTRSLRAPSRSRTTELSIGTAVVVVAVASVLPLFVHGIFILGVLTDSLVYVTLSLSYNVVVGYVGAFSFAQPAFLGVGAYTAAILCEHVSVSIIVQALVAVACASLVALAIAIPAFRLSHMTFAMVTLGFTLIIQLFVTNQVGLTGGPMCISGLSSLGLAAQQYYVFLIIAVLVGGFTRAIASSRVGRAYVAIREDEAMAAAAGINATRYRYSAFILSAGIAGMLGAFYAHYLTVVCPSDMNEAYTTTLLVVLFLGGVGGFWGIVAAAFIFTAIPESLVSDPNIQLMIYGLALLICVMVMPTGMEGLVKRLRSTLRSRSASRA